MSGNRRKDKKCVEMGENDKIGYDDDSGGDDDDHEDEDHDTNDDNAGWR